MILVCGENLIDYIQEPSDGPLPLYRAYPGGSPFNTAMAIGRQSVPVGYMMPISNDSLGQLLRSTLEDSSVICLAEASDHPTALAVVSLNNGQPSYQFYRDNTADRQVTLQGLLAASPEQITACHFGGAAIANGKDGDAVAEFASELASDGVPVTFDPNIRPAFIDARETYLPRFEQTLKATDLLKLSDEDMEWLFPDTDIEESAQNIFDAEDLGLLILTKGGDGAIAFTKHGRKFIPAAPVPNLVDTVGAGDTFMATVVSELTKRDLIGKAALRAAPEDQIEIVLSAAAKAAAINCGRKGCNPPTALELHR